MADTAITATTLTKNAVSADVLTNAEGGTSVTAGNTAVIGGIGNATDRLVITIYGSGGAATATVKAGDRPPALLAGQGDVALTIPASDCLLVAVEAGRFMQDDATDSGKIRIDIATNTCIVGAYLLPKTV